MLNINDLIGVVEVRQSYAFRLDRFIRDIFMKRSIATTLLVATLVFSGVDMFAHAPGTQFTRQEWNEWSSAQPREKDLVLLKDGSSLEGLVTVVPTANVAGNAINFKPEQLSVIATVFVDNHPKVQWMTLSGYSYITDVPGEAIQLADKKIALESIETVIFHNTPVGATRPLATVEMKNGDVFPVQLLSEKVLSTRGELATADFYDVLFDGGLHGTLKHEGKYQFVPHTTLTNSSIQGQIPNLNETQVLNLNQVNRIQSDSNGFVDQSRSFCHNKSCDEPMPGIFTINYVEPEEGEGETFAVLDPKLAGAFAYAPDPITAFIEPAGDLNEPEDRSKEAKPQGIAPNQFSINELHIRSLPDVVFLDSHSKEAEKLFEEIYLSQLNEELQLMNDYDELLRALAALENREILKNKEEELRLAHDYHELMGAYSYNHEYDLLVQYKENLQFHSDYDELIEAFAAQDIDKKAFDIKFNDASAEEDLPLPSDAIDFAKLFQAVEWQLQSQMEEGELAYVTNVLEKSKSQKAE